MEETDIITTIQLLLLSLIIIAIAISDSRLNIGYANPFLLLSVPMLIILWFINFSSFFMPIEPFDIMFIPLLGSYLLLFKLIGVIVNAIILTNNNGKLAVMVRDASTDEMKKKINKTMKVLSSVSSVILILYFVLLAKSYPKIAYIVSDAFQEHYTSGINFYLRLICYMATIYFIGDYKRADKKGSLWIILSITPIALTFVKGSILLPIVSGFVFKSIYSKEKIKISSVIMFVFLGVCIFLSLNFMEQTIWNSGSINIVALVGSILSKMSIYIISGLQSFNVNIHHGTDFFVALQQNPVFAPFINFMAKFGITQSISNVPDNWTTIVSNHFDVNSQVNVNSFFGTLILYTGYTTTLIVTVVISVISHYYYHLAVSKGDVIIKLIYAVIGGALAMGWFEYFFLHPFIYYLFIILGLLSIYLRHGVLADNKL